MAADHLRKQRRRAEEMVQQHRSTQALCLAAETKEAGNQITTSYCNTFAFKTVEYLYCMLSIFLATNNRQPAGVGQLAILCR